jgi:hypothetical protein
MTSRPKDVIRMFKIIKAFNGFELVGFDSSKGVYQFNTIEDAKQYAVRHGWIVVN